MPSNIDPTQPPALNPTTAAMRANMAAAKSEIEALQNLTKGGLTATGNDQTAEIQQYMNDTAGFAGATDFAPGDFIINGSIILHARQKDVIETKGYGLKMVGSGPETTRFLDVRVDKSTPCFLVTDPDGITVNRRAIMSYFADFSLIAASPAGIPFSLATTPDGVGFMARASNGSGFGAHVLHSSRLSRVRFSGHQYSVSLDDTTQVELDHVRFTRFLTAVRLGGNCDIITFNHCGWGSESSTSDASWMAACAIENKWDAGYAVGFGSNIININNAWVMRIGTFFRNLGVADTNVGINKSYLEAVRRYYHADFATDVLCSVAFDDCHFSMMSTNDAISSDRASVDYSAKIQFGSTGIDTSLNTGPIPNLLLKDIRCNATNKNALVSFNKRTGSIKMQDCVIPASTDGFGHLRCINNSNETWRTVSHSNAANGVGISAKFTDQNAAGLGKVLGGEPITKAATITAGATYSIHLMEGDRHELTLPDGDCTIDMYTSATLPLNKMARGAECEVFLIAPATITANRTITFGSKLALDASTLTMSTTDGAKIAVFKLKGLHAGGVKMIQNSPFPTFISPI